MFSGDEQKAFDEFFRLVPSFVRDREEIGRDGILSRFSEIQDQLMTAFEKDLIKAKRTGRNPVGVEAIL
jgi:hypothetical protein